MDLTIYGIIIILLQFVTILIILYSINEIKNIKFQVINFESHVSNLLKNNISTDQISKKMVKKKKSRKKFHKTDNTNNKSKDIEINTDGVNNNLDNLELINSSTNLITPVSSNFMTKSYNSHSSYNSYNSYNSNNSILYNKNKNKNKNKNENKMSTLSEYSDIEKELNTDSMYVSDDEDKTNTNVNYIEARVSSSGIYVDGPKYDPYISRNVVQIPSTPKFESIISIDDDYT